MRFIFILTLFAINYSVLATPDKDPEWIPKYRITSDTYDASLKPGTVLVKGMAYEESYDAQGVKLKTPIVHAKTSTIDQTSSCLTSATGEYEFTISATDSVIYLYKYRYEEVVISAYDFKSQHVVTIDFFPGHSEKMILTEKPVIYVYSPDEVAVKVKVDQIGEMTFTYPKLEESWKFTADTSGEITMNDGNKYPYLFWEANRSELGATVNNHIIPGEIVAKKDIVHFLETSLLALGLTAKEKTDFITYWGPRMQTFNNTFIQFTIDDEVGPLIGALQVDPKPDSFRRVFVRFMDANEINLFAIYTLQKQSFTSFKREGLTVVEWGGSEIHKIMLYEN